MWLSRVAADSITIGSIRQLKVSPIDRRCGQAEAGRRASGACGAEQLALPSGATSGCKRGSRWILTVAENMGFRRRFERRRRGMPRFLAPGSSLSAAIGTATGCFVLREPGC